MITGNQLTAELLEVPGDPGGPGGPGGPAGPAMLRAATRRKYQCNSEVLLSSKQLH